MLNGSRKYEYNRAAFGEFVRVRRQSLGWSYRQLATYVFNLTSISISAGTILHIERGERSLPEGQRKALEAALDPPSGVGVIKPHDAPSVHPAALPEDPLTLEGQSQWDAAKERYLRLAAQAKEREMWPEWAAQSSHAGLMEMMLGRYKESAALFDEILHKDVSYIGKEALSETLQNHGWLDMVRHDFASSASYLCKSDNLLRELGMSRTRTFHFLGRTYCAWGIERDDETLREAGRNLLTHASSLDENTGNLPSLGFDLLQQIPSMVFDDVSSARRHLARSRELLGTEAYMLGHFHLKSGLVLQYSDCARAREHWEQASIIYSRDMFYANGVGETLRLLSSSLYDHPTTLTQAASYALVAAVAHPYRESLDLLESTSFRIFSGMCDGVVRRFTAFWADQVEKVSQRDEMPFALLKALAQRPDGPAYIRITLQRAQTAISNGLPDHLDDHADDFTTHCLTLANVP